MYSENSISTIDIKYKNKKVCKFDEALTLTGFGTYNYFVTLTCGIISLGNICETMGLGFVITAAQCDLDLTMTQKGWLIAIPYIGIVIASQLWGYLADTRGRRRILMISTSIGSILSILCSLSPNLTVFAIIRFLSAAMMAASNAIVYAYFGELTPKTHADMMISVLSSIVLTCTVICSGIAWGILQLNFNIPISFFGFHYKPWRLLLLCYAIPFLLAALVMVKAPESPKYLMSHGKNEQVLKLLRQIYSINSGKDKSSFPVDVVVLDEQDKNVKNNKNNSFFSIIWNQTVPIMKPPLVKYSLLLIVIAFGILGCGNGFFVWLPEIMDRFYIAVNRGEANKKTFCEIIDSKYKHLEGMNSTYNSTILVCDDSFKFSTYPTILAYTSIITLCNILVAVLLKWISKKIILLISLGAGTFSVFLIYFISNYYVSWILIIIFQSTCVLLGIISAFAVEVFPTQYRAMGVSTILLCGRIGSIVFTNLMALLLDTNCELNFFLFASLLAACFVAGLFLPSKRKTENTKL